MHEQYLRSKALLIGLNLVSVSETINNYCLNNVSHQSSPTALSMPDVKIFPHATGAAELVVAQHQEPQELVFYSGWVWPNLYPGQNNDSETQSSFALTFNEPGLRLKSEGYLTNTRKSILIVKILNS